MALASKKRLPPKQHSSPSKKEELVPLRFSVDAELYAFLKQIAKRSGKSVSAIVSMYLTVAVDKETKIDPCVDRAMQQVVAEDITHRFGPLLRFLSPWKAKRKISN